MKYGYIGYVYDRLTEVYVYKTRHNPTWELAHHAAERGAKRKGLKGDRYKVAAVRDWY